MSKYLYDDRVENAIQVIPRFVPLKSRIGKVFSDIRFFIRDLPYCTAAKKRQHFDLAHSARKIRVAISLDSI